MDKLVINGGTKLVGEVEVSRAKNAYLPILAAVLLSDQKIELIDVPNLRDIKTMWQLLQNLGVKTEVVGNITHVDASNITSQEATYELVKTMRASIFVLGPLLSRFKRAKVSLPGGCAIGTRPIDLHLKNLEKMGAKIVMQNGYVEATCDELVGTKLVLDFPSVGATENLLMAGVFAKGITTIDNAALEPEIDDLAHFLQSMGVSIEGIGTKTLKVTGLTKLKPTRYRAIGDRIEAGTYLMAGLITGGDVKVRGFDPAHLFNVAEKLREMGAIVEELSDGLHARSNGVLKAVDISTEPYPGFPTDLQAQMMALMTHAHGTSVMTENIFENRFMHVPELVRLGSKIKLKGNSAIVKGPTPLAGAPVMCTDLRASAALVLAALASSGTTDVLRVYHLDRGYENLDSKLMRLGARIERSRESDMI